MKKKLQEGMVYQVRMKPGRDPEDVVMDLTYAIWQAVAGIEGLALDSHRWTDIYEVVKDVFRNRLFRQQECGKQAECGVAVGVYERYGLPRRDDSIYLLHLRGGLDRFVEGLGALAWRRLYPQAAGLASSEWRNAFHSSLRNALAGEFYFAPACTRCHVREAFTDRRIWESLTGLSRKRIWHG